MIPKTEYIEFDGTKVITFQLFAKHHTTEDLLVFAEWYSGQTGMTIEDDKIGIYVCDYERWIRENKLDHQLPGTFD